MSKEVNEVIVKDSGLRMIVRKTGEGDKPKKGQTVKAHYIGYLEDREIFDSSVARQKPFEFPVGQGRVIKGWDEAFLDMKVGEKRTLIIPPDLGYGDRGAPPKIPGGAVLIFDVELLEVK